MPWQLSTLAPTQAKTRQKLAMEIPPPRFSPDNSAEARQRRIAQGGAVLRIIEHGDHRYILGALNQVVGVRHLDPAPPDLPAVDPSARYTPLD